MPTVVVIHHRPVIRLGLVAMLLRDADIDVVGHGETPGVIPVDLSGRAHLDLLILPARLPPNEPLRRAARELAGLVPMLAVDTPTPRRERLVELRAGVLDRISADVTQDELVAAVRSVALRGSRSSARRCGAGSADDRRTTADVPLSPREREALAWIAQGLTHHQVGRRMGIAKSTVDTYVERIRHKLRLGNKAELALAAVDQAYLPADVVPVAIRGRDAGHSATV
jgi:DNA-binding NarL/FixJ family response regulator